MVGIVSGNNLGLSLTSLALLGQRGLLGSAGNGRSGEQAFVNAATGNLVLQTRDELLIGRGTQASALRTYNSLGQLTDDNGDNWSNGIYTRQLQLTGTARTAGSTLVRTNRDGARATYSWDATRSLYITTDGAGAHDTIRYETATTQWVWVDGDTGASERYDSAATGRLLSTDDGRGNTLSYAYLASGLLSNVLDSSGERTWFDYTGTNLTQIRTVLTSGTTTQTLTRVRYGYDTSNRLTSVTVDLSPGDNAITDGRVYTTTYTYDGTSRRLASVTQTDGTKLTIGYLLVGADYRVSTLTDALGNVTKFTYDTANRRTTVTDPLNLSTTLEYDTAGRLLKTTGPAVGGVSAVRSVAYAANGDVTGVTDGEGRSITMQYDAAGNLTLQRDAAGNTVTRTYDARNQLATETRYEVADPDGAGALLPSVPRTTRYVYDAAGKNLLRFMISAEGGVTEHRYDAYGQRTATLSYAGNVYPIASLTGTAVPAEATMATWAGTTDRLRVQRVDYAYDFRGQVTTRTEYAKTDATGAGAADGTQAVTSYVYDAAGLLLKTISPKDGTTTYTYDGLGRQLTRTDASGAVTATVYDDAGGKTRVTLANGLVTSSSYDKAGRLTSVLQTNAAAANLGETKYWYDADGQLRMTRDANGIQRHQLWDEAGRKVAEIDGDGSLTEFVYDRNAQVIQTVRHATAIAGSVLYDSVTGQPRAVALATIRPAAGALTQKSWSVYDTANRLVKTVDTLGYVTENVYDGASRLVRTTRYTNAIAVAALPANPLASAIAPVAVAATDRTARYFYDGDGLLRGSLDAEGYLVEQRYDAAGRLTERIAYATATTATLRANGTLAQLLPAANAAGDRRTVTLYNGRGLAAGVVDAEGYLTERVYDGAGRPTQEVRYATKVAVAYTAATPIATLRPASSALDQVQRRAYDALGRLSLETAVDGTQTQYLYDSVGNLTSTIRAVGAAEVRTLSTRFDLEGQVVAELSAEGAALLTGTLTQAQIDAIWAQYAVRHAYDAGGRRISTTDALGNRTLFFYDSDDRLTYTINALGEVEVRVYDVMNRLASVSRVGTRITTTGLSGGTVPATLVTAMAAARNVALDATVAYTYNQVGQLTAVRDALGFSTTRAYNAFGELTSQVEPRSSSVTVAGSLAYDRRGFVTSRVADAGGLSATETIEYDAFGRVVRTVDANGNVRRATFDRLGRQVGATDPLGAGRSSTYDAFDRVLTQTDALGNVTRYAYNTAARSVAVTTAEGITVTTVRDRLGQVMKVTDGRGGITSYTYDRNGALVSTTTPLTSTASRFDRGGRLIETTDTRGIKVTYTYDAAGRTLTRATDPTGLNLVQSWTYDALGRSVTSTDANAIVTRFAYDLKGRRLSQTVDPTGLNLVTTWSYDAQDSVLTVTAPGGTVVQYVYDKLGRRTEERTDPTGLNLVRRFTYDRTGNLLSTADALGNVTRNVYDANDRLVYTVDPAGGVQQRIYDVEGRVVRTVRYSTAIATSTLPAAPAIADIAARVVANAALDTTEWRIWDRDSRLRWTVDGAGGVTQYVYDANGNVVDRIGYATPIALATWTVGSTPAPTGSTSDQRIRTVYDALNRAVYTIDATGAVVQTAYDGAGNVTDRIAYSRAIPTATAATQAAVSAAVALVVDTARDTRERRVFDAGGRLTWTADGTGAVVQYQYDRNGNVLKRVQYATAIAGSATPSSVVAGAADRTTSWAYDAANRQVFALDAVGAVTEQVFDRNGNVVQRVAYSRSIATGTGSTIAAMRAAIVVDAANDRVMRSVFDAAGRQVFGIDSLGVVSERQYDAAGNVTVSTGYAKAVSTATLTATATVASVRALIVADAANDRTTRRVVDAAGREVFSIDSLWGVKQTRYDALGRAVSTTEFDARIAATTPLTVAGVGSAVTAAANAARDRTESYTYNAAGRLVATTDALGAVESNGYDALGQRTRYTNKKGSVWTYAYDAAGRMTSETSPQVMLAAVAPDAAGRLVATSNAAASIVTQIQYDALGNVTARTEAAGRAEARTTRYDYDAAGRQIRTTFQAVAVYAGETDAALAANGQASAASRVESVQTLYTQTFYDTLGNAVASRDMAGAVSSKTYDTAGRVSFEVDALGFVTGYTRNAFGETTRLVRYAVPTSLAPASIASAAEAPTGAAVSAAVNAAGVNHGADRTITTAYDRLGRAVEVVEPIAENFDSTLNQVFSAGRTTRSVYNAFGEVVQVSQLRSAASNAWTQSYSYFDRLGQLVASVDAGGYLTTRAYDTAGNLTRTVEWANVATGISVTGYTAPAANADDRAVSYAWDRGNRKVSENRESIEVSDATNGTSARANVLTTYGYDAVGNLTRTTQQTGASTTAVTYSYYDALGRVTAVAAPTRTGTTDGSNTVSLTPLTVFSRDAYGNVVVKLDYANGAAAANEVSFVAGTASGADRAAYSRYDVRGLSVHTTDATGANRYVSYDAMGRVAKEWQPVAGGDGVTRTIFRVYQYDRLGHQLAVLDPASTSRVSGTSIVEVDQATAGLARTALEYNAFGEVVRRGTEGGRQEYFDYDNAGRLLRTNSGDGADRLLAYDLLGRNTAEFRNSGLAVDGTDLKLTAVSTALGLSNLRRTDMRYDALGRVVETVLPQRLEQQGGVSVQRLSTAARIASGATVTFDESGHASWWGPNVVEVSWSTLASLGSGDVRVDIEYLTGTYTVTTGGQTNESGQVINPGTSQTVGGGTASRSQILTAEQGVTSARFSWADSGDPNGGISAVKRLRVFKKDVNGGWQKVYDVGSFGATGNLMNVAAPNDPRQSVVLQLRVAGSAGDTGWFVAPLVNFGSLMQFDASSLGSGSWEYRVTTGSADGRSSAVTGSGTVTLAPPPLSAIAVPITFGPAGDGVLAWQSPGLAIEQRLMVRQAGSGGAWTSFAVADRGNGLDGADLKALAAGTYEYELVWVRAGEGVPYAHATGTTTVVASVPARWVPPANLPNIAGVVRSGVLVDYTVVGTDESGQEIRTGGRVIPVLRWNLDSSAAMQLRYRLVGGSWANLPIVNDITGSNESGMLIGTQFAKLDSLAVGTYEFQLLAMEGGSTVPTSQATGIVTINAAVPGRYETRYVQVQVPYTVTPPDPSNYIIGWTGTGPTYGAPVVVGYQGGYPICGQGYAVVWNYSESGATYGGIVAVPYTAYRTETRTEWVPVQVIVGWTPQIMGYDESGAPYYAYDANGNIAYSPIYETRWEPRTVNVQVPYTVYPPDPSNFIISPHSGSPIYGSPVVAGRDESGNIIYGFGYGVVNGSVVSIPYTAYRTETQPQQVWVPGYTPDPSWTVTTPPYTPGYWIAAQPTRYAASVSTPASSVSTSLSGSAAGASMTQGAGINGSSANVRPAIQQTYDRWGNVVTVSDPRSAYWLTRYRYNSNNQRIQETRPDSSGATSADSPTTSFYFDRLGRQVAVKDANGNVNGQQWDAGSNLVQETHADGGVVSYAFNAFGEKLRMTDELGKATVYTYDRLSRLTATTRGVSNVYTVNGANALQFVATRALVDSAIYDAAGRKLSQTNGDGETTTYRYDARGQVIATIQPGGLVSRTAYDSNGRTVGETNQNGALATWGYDYFGQLQARRDIGGATYGYAYDRARQLVRQTNTRGQDLRMTYDAAGQLLRQQDVPQDKWSIFEYDRAGRHVREVTIQAGVFYQDNRLAYDALGRLRSVADSRVNLLLDYDRNGNRTRIRSSVIDSTGVLRYQDRYFAYDAMNRQTLVDGLNAAGAIGAGQGHRVTYDKAGNRKTDTFWGNRVTTINGSTQIAGYDESGGAIYSTTPTTWTTTQGESTETYAYDNNGRLSGVVRDGVQIDHRFYDGAGRVVQTGPNGNLPQGYAAALNQGVASGAVNGLETRINRFDDNGRLLHQRVLKSDNAAKYEIAYSSYDPAGNLLRYTLTNQDGTAYTNTYAYSYETREAYQESRIDGTSTRFNAGASVTAYDANGFQKSFTDSTSSANNRNFVTDAAGRVLWENQAGHVDRQLIVNGEVLGRFGDAIDEVNPRDGSGNPQFKQVADFNFGYQPINGNYPSASPGTYRVRAGDTLASIARGAYGDSKLWYRIAEANGISDDRDLRVGQTLSVPAGVGTVHNDGESFKPYDPSKIMGDTTPNLPTPSGGGGCGGLGLVLVVIVAVAVTVVTAGAAAVALGAVPAGTGVLTAGGAVLSGGIAGGATIASTGMAVGAAAIGGAAGSVASQGVAIAMGMQDSINWKQVALSAVGSAVSSGVGQAAQGTWFASRGFEATVARAAVGNAATQAIGVAAGLQGSFNWRGVAASAIGSAVGQGVAGAMDYGLGRLSSNFMDQVARGTVSGVAAGAAASIARGGKLVMQQVAADAFGNALGSSLAEIAGRPSERDHLISVDPISAEERSGTLAMFNDGPGGTQGTGYTGGQDFAADVQRRRELIAMGIDPNEIGDVADGAAAMATRTIDPRRALALVQGRLSTRIASDTAAGVRGTIEGSIRDLADPRFADALRSQYVLTEEQQAGVAAVQQRYGAIGWNDGDYRRGLSAFSIGFGGLEDDVVRLHALTNIAQGLNPGYRIESDVNIGRMPVLWGRDLLLLGLPSRIMGGLQGFLNGPAGYGNDGNPVFLNPRTHSFQGQEEIAFEIAAAGVLPAPGARGGPGIARSGLAFGSPASEKFAATLARVEADSLRVPLAQDELLTVISPKTGQVLGQVLHPGGRGRPPDSFLSAMDGNVFTHNHPSGGSLGFEDVGTAIAYGARQVRAVGSEKTYVLDINLPPSAESAARRNFSTDVIMDAATTQQRVVRETPGFYSLPKADRANAFSNALHDYWTNLSTRYPDYFRYTVTPTKR